jgi:hypothetical protein
MTDNIVNALVAAACKQEREPSEANQNAYRAARGAVEAALADRARQAPAPVEVSRLAEIPMANGYSLSRPAGRFQSWRLNLNGEEVRRLTKFEGEFIDAALAAASTPVGEVPAGWKLVPIETTDEQIADAIEFEFSVSHEWPEGDGEIVRAFIKNFAR